MYLLLPPSIPPPSLPPSLDPPSLNPPSLPPSLPHPTAWTVTGFGEADQRQDHCRWRRHRCWVLGVTAPAVEGSHGQGEGGGGGGREGRGGGGKISDGFYSGFVQKYPN